MHPVMYKYKPNSPVTATIKRKNVLLISIAVWVFFCVMTPNCPFKQLHGLFRVGRRNCLLFVLEDQTRHLIRIMMWTSRSQKWYGTLDDTRRGEILLEHCSAKCVITNNPCLVEFSDAVVFHAPDISISDLPPRRHSWQRWVFHTMETPKSIEYVDLNPVRDVFNWTMTYRSDSDVYVPYGRIMERGAKPTATKGDMKVLWKTKNRTAVWPVSDCTSYGGREHFYAELQQYVDVDVYGKCGPHDCPKTGGHVCYEHFERNYHFMLSFEDSICEEYVTEKLFTALKYDIVPVVFGGANYSRIAPRHSYIDAFAFESSEKLAQYLVTLSRNYTEYVAYFKWKESQSVEPLKSAYCELCTKLHSDPTARRSSSYQDIRAWWLEQSRCRVWESASTAEENTGPR